MNLGRIVPLALALLVAAASSAGADEVIYLDRNEAFSDQQRIRAVFQPTPSSSRVGTYGFMRVVLHNPDPKEPHHFTVVSESEVGNVSGRFRRSAMVGPGEKGAVFLPIPGGQDWPRISAWLDGRATSARRHLSVGGRSNVAILEIGLHGTSGSEFAWTNLVKAGSTPSAEIRWRTPDEIPAAFQLLSGFDLIIVQSPLTDLPDALQRTLVRYVAAGGRLVITGAGPALDGALAALETSLDARPAQAPGRGLRAGRHGLGAWLAVGTTAVPESTFGAWWDQQVVGGELVTRPTGGSLPSFLWLPLSIPGLGDVPVLAFFLLLLVFAVVAGPLCYAYFKRRRKLAWLLVTIPAMGFLFSAAILLYGFLSEGFGISGAVRSFTVLDQRTHEAVVSAGRTLFAGLPVASIDPSADTLLGVAQRGRWDDPPTRLDADLDQGFRLDGAALPSRTPTTFVTTTVGRLRDRLRFKRLEDGSYEVLAGPDFAPVAGEGAVLLRTPEGGYFLSSASGRLTPLGTETSEQAIRRILDGFVTAPIESRNVNQQARRALRPFEVRARGGAVLAPESAWAETTVGALWVDALVGDTLPPGAYLAHVETLPGLDALGLDVDMRFGEHVVFGILDEEDVLE